MDRRTREAVRYLGYGNHAIDESTLQLIHDSFCELEEIAKVRFVYRIFEISNSNAGELIIGTMQIKSDDLSKNLHGCESVIVFGGTLGAEVDRRMKKYSVMDMTKAVVLQACAAAYLEEQCDMWQDSIGGELGADLYLRPRFSPGYGDFPIYHQEELLRILDAQKKIGLTMTDAYMLTPTKSVTAVIGITKEKEPCKKRGCKECAKKDCIYRRSEICC